MLEMTFVNNDMLCKDIFKDVLFFSIAEGGAMGVPGEIIVINKKPEAYSMNYVYGDVNVNDVEKLFPVLKGCRFGLFGKDSEVPENWNYVSLGMGNHLIVADEVYDQFMWHTRDCKEDYEYYDVWQEAARIVVGLPDADDNDKSRPAKE